MPSTQTEIKIELEDSVSHLEKPWESLIIRINQAGDRVPEFEDKVEDLDKLNKENGRSKMCMVRNKQNMLNVSPERWYILQLCG